MKMILNKIIANVFVIKDSLDRIYVKKLVPFLEDWSVSLDLSFEGIWILLIDVLLILLRLFKVEILFVQTELRLFLLLR